MENALSVSGLTMLIKDEFHLAEASAATSWSHLVKVGELLTQAKFKIEHGGWGSWVASHLPFGLRQAQRYMQYYEHRDELEAKATCETLLGMSSALALIANERPGADDNTDREQEHVVQEQVDAESTPPPRRPVMVEVIRPRAAEPIPTKKANAASDAEPVAPRNSKEAYPACAKFPEVRTWLWKLRHELMTREDRGWRTREQGVEVVKELRKLLALAESIGGDTK